MRLIFLACGLLASPLFGAAGRAADPAADAEFFEAKVRPLLVEQCARCHGGKKQMAGLRLDTADGFKKGSDDGPVVAGTDPTKSKLIEAVKRAGDYPMPPDDALPAAAVAVLEEWVRRGATFPVSVAPPAADAKALAAKHWAFQPVKDAPVPAAGPADAAPVDKFLLEKLAEKGARLAAPADKRTLLRRAAVDLTGLTPSAAELDAFAADTDPQAFAKAVDKLLASPHYGERWGRYWLDIARYADSKGYVFQENRAYPFAYTYRDYVIRSLNDDKPYDRFVTEQVAADRLDLGADPKPLAALGFLTLGRRFVNNQHDIIDDRIDVVTRGFLGLTVQCARCHDHKFDPVPAADYYALYGVFASSTEPKDLPAIGAPSESRGYKEFEAELGKREKALADFRAKRHAEITAELRTPAGVAKYLLFAQKVSVKPDGEARDIAREELMRAGAFQRWRRFVADVTKTTPPAWKPWVLAAKAADVPAALAKLPDDVPPTVRDAVRAADPKTLADLAAVYGTLAQTDPILKAVIGAGGPTDSPAAEVERVYDRVDREAQTKLQQKIDGYKAASPFAPARAMALVDLPNPQEPVIFTRGNPATPGAKVSRHAPTVIDASGTPFKVGSGRLELAKAITDPKNPLTARVMVNRVWAGHFGRPLVSTPSDFGLRSDPPTHPELLDYLATRFVADGWSLKKLHRRMMLTTAYQQGAVNPAATAADPENKLVGRMTPRRLDFEAMRDNVLLAGGKLDRTVYGRSIDLFAKPYTPRRAVYASVDRQNLPGTLRTFDFASPDSHSPGRHQTTVPQQALFFMNSPFLIEQAKAVTLRPEVVAAKAPAAKVTALYRAVLGRKPSAAEAKLAAEFIALPTKPKEPTGWELFAQALLMSNEFAFAD